MVKLSQLRTCCVARGRRARARLHELLCAGACAWGPTLALYRVTLPGMPLCAPCASCADVKRQRWSRPGVRVVMLLCAGGHVTVMTHRSIGVGGPARRVAMVHATWCTGVTRSRAHIHACAPARCGGRLTRSGRGSSCSARATEPRGRGIGSGGRQEADGMAVVPLERTASCLQCFKCGLRGHLRLRTCRRVCLPPPLPAAPVVAAVRVWQPATVAAVLAALHASRAVASTITTPAFSLQGRLCATGSPVGRGTAARARAKVPRAGAHAPLRAVLRCDVQRGCCAWRHGAQRGEHGSDGIRGRLSGSA